MNVNNFFSQQGQPFVEGPNRGRAGTAMAELQPHHSTTLWQHPFLSALITLLFFLLMTPIIPSAFQLRLIL